MMIERLTQNIKYYRNLTGITQEKLSELVGVSTQAVSKWEQGISFPDIQILPLLADIFNVSIDELFGRTVEKEVVFMLDDSTPWKDDNKVHIAIYSGRKLAHQSTYEVQEGKNHVSFNCMDNFYDIRGVCTYYGSNERQKTFEENLKKN